MSVSTDDPSGLLPNRTETLDYTVTTDPLEAVISVEYQSGTWEVAYQDGRFAQRYSASTLDGSTFHVRRAGGWLTGMKLYVKETAPAIGLGMGTIYEVDLTAQGSQSMDAAGAYVIDGLTWWAKGPLQQVGAVSGLVSGLGLMIQQPATITTANAWRSFGLVTYPDRLLALALAQIPEFNPSAPLAVIARMTGLHQWGGSGEDTGKIGLTNAALSSASLTGAEKGTALTVGRVSASAARLMYSPYGSSDNYQMQSSPVISGTVLDNAALGIFRFGVSRYFPLFGEFTGVLGGTDDYNGFTLSATTAVKNGSGQSASPCFCFLFDVGSNQASSQAVYLTHLKVMQPVSP